MQQKQTDTQQKKHKVQYIQDETQLSDAASSEVASSDEDFKLHRIGRQSPELIIISLWLNGYRHNMGVDTGATFSVISETTRQQIFSSETLHSSDLSLEDICTPMSL